MDTNILIFLVATMVFLVLLLRVWIAFIPSQHAHSLIRRAQYHQHEIEMASLGDTRDGCKTCHDEPSRCICP